MSTKLEYIVMACVIAFIAALIIMAKVHDANAHDPNAPALGVKRLAPAPIADFSQRKARHAKDWCANQVTGEFDDEIKRQHRKHFPNDPAGWCKSKTVAFVESSLRANAVSPVGAQSLFQLMPGTFARFARCRNAFDPACNIATGIKHQAYLNTFWHFKRSQDCRNQLVWASSNAGEGTVLKEQVRQGGALCISPAWRLPSETRHHLGRINKYLDARSLRVM